jgi:hypothetical protein
MSPPAPLQVSSPGAGSHTKLHVVWVTHQMVEIRLGVKRCWAKQLPGRVSKEVSVKWSHNTKICSLTNYAGQHSSIGMTQQFLAPWPFRQGSIFLLEPEKKENGILHYKVQKKQFGTNIDNNFVRALIKVFWTTYFENILRSLSLRCLWYLF